jgi:signal transduction histidine kinase/DNA-binding response OmpR family regulator
MGSPASISTSQDALTGSDTPSQGVRASEHVPTITNSDHLKVLLIEDNPGDARLIRELLAEQRVANFDVLQVDRLAPGLALTTAPIDAVLLDLNLPDSQGLATFRRLHTTAAWLPIVVLSGLADEAVAVQAVGEGAQDYLVKGSVDGASLGRAVRYAVERQRAERALRLSEERLRLLAQAGIVLGASLDDLTILRGVADLTVPVFADCCLVDVVDESGTITRVAAAFGDLGHQDLAPVLLQRDKSPSVPMASSGVHGVIATGRPELRPHVDPLELGAVLQLLGLTADDAVSEAFQRLSPRSSIVVPARSHAQILGAITFLRGDNRVPFGADDLQLAEELGRRAGGALANAGLYQVAQASVRERDELLAVVAHDLRTPLAGIAGYVDLTLRRATRTKRLDAGALEWLHRAKAIARSMARDLGDLVDAASLQSGRALPLRAELVDLVALARRLTGDFQALSPRHLLRVETSVEALPGDWDLGRVERVLANLLTNAIKYSPEGSPVTVSVHQETDADGQSWAVLIVRDEGVGIPADEISRVSTRFFRASNVMRRFPGSGIGLAGAREVIEQHGGSLHIDSEEHRGTTVTVRLPSAPSAIGQTARAATADPIRHDRGAQIRVLVVEDDPATRDLLANVLRQNGYVVLEATNGEAGRRVAEREQPDLILLDLVLPEQAGIETLRTLREQPPTRSIPVVVASGSATELEAVGELADARLAKPFDAAVLLATIEHSLAQSQGQ